MLKVGMMVSFLVADLDQQVNEEVRSNPPRPKAIIEPLCVIQDQLLVTKSGTLYIQCFEQYVPGTSTQENACSLPPEAEGMSAGMHSLYLQQCILLDRHIFRLC